MRLGNAAHPIVKRDIQWEIQIIGSWRAPGLDAKRIGAKGLERIGIGPEEAL